jgi:hypothetical protein
LTASSGVLEKSTVCDFDFEEGPIFSHYAEAVKITEAYVMGTPIEALCGKIFIPHRDPEKFPICPQCRELAEALFLI